jgi:uncharacterized protein YjbI with pentapeptide repeats
MIVLNTANLRGADLRGANLSDADLGGATMPTGQNYEDWLKDRERRKEDSQDE